MSFTLKGVERALKSDPRRTLSRRSDEQLPFLGAEATGGHALLLDTCVYIDQLQGRAPPIVEDLLDLRIVNHSAVAIQELLHAVGALDPVDRRSKPAIAAIRKVIAAMPAHRRFAADLDVLAEAAVCAGILSRIQGYARDDRLRALNDSTLYLQAIKLGLCLLTRNLAEFDILSQLRPEGSVLFYRVAA